MPATEGPPLTAGPAHEAIPFDDLPRRAEPSPSLLPPQLQLQARERGQEAVEAAADRAAATASCPSPSSPSRQPQTLSPSSPSRQSSWADRSAGTPMLSLASPGATKLPLVDSPDEQASPTTAAELNRRAAGPAGGGRPHSVTMDLHEVSLQLAASSEGQAVDLSFFGQPNVQSPPAAAADSPFFVSNGSSRSPRSPRPSFSPTNALSPRSTKGPKLAPLNTNTVYLPPAAGDKNASLTPSQVRWQQVRDVVVGHKSDSPPKSAGQKVPMTTPVSSRRATGDDIPANAPPMVSSARAGFLANLGLRSFAPSDNGKQRADGSGSSQPVRPTAKRSGSSDLKTSGGWSKPSKSGSAPFGFLLGSSGSSSKDRRGYVDPYAASLSGPDPRYVRFEAEMRVAVQKERKGRELDEQRVANLGEDGTTGATPPSSGARTRTGHSKSSSNQSSYSSYGHTSAGSTPLSAILQVLHAYVPSASQAWAQPFPCEREVLSELARPYVACKLKSGRPSIDYRQMALEVFALIAKYWRSATEDDELHRWTWILSAVETDDLVVRSRAVPLLASLVDPLSPTAPIPTHPQSCTPSNPFAFRTLLSTLLQVSRVLTEETPLAPAQGHHQRSGSLPSTLSSPLDVLQDIVARLRQGQLLLVNPETIITFYGLDEDALSDHQWDAAALSEALAWDTLVWMIDSLGSDDRRYLIRSVLPSFAIPIVEDPTRLTPDILVQRSASAALCRSLRRQLHQSAADGPNDGPEAATYTERDRIHVLGYVRTRFANFLLSNHTMGLSWPVDCNDAALAAELVGLLLALALHRPTAQVHTDDGAVPPSMAEESAADQAYTLAEELWASGARWKSAFHQSFLSFPPVGHAQASALLQGTRDDHPKLFYGALFRCAASDKADVVLLNHRIVRATADILSIAAYWLVDAEMLAMAVVGTSPAALPGPPPAAAWSKVKLGQLVVITDLVEAIHDYVAQATDEAIERHERFFEVLENRISVLIEFKERSNLICLSHRAALATLLFSIRSASQAKSSPVWLPRILDWLSSCHLGATAALAHSSTDPFLNDPTAPAPITTVTTVELAEVPLSTGRVKEIFRLALAESSRDESLVDQYLLADDADWSTPDLPGLCLCVDAAPVLTRLLVLTYWALSLADLRTLAPLILNHHMLGPQETSMAWLINYIAEKDPSSLSRLLEESLTSQSPSVKLDAIVRLATLYDMRQRVPLEEHVPDPRGRRPFKHQKRPIGFVPTEIGRPTKNEQEAIKENDPRYEGLPYSLRKRLAALDWNGEGDAHAFLAQSGRQTPPGRHSPGGSPSRSPRRRVGSRSPSPSPDATDLPIFSDALFSIAAIQVSALLKSKDEVIAAASRDLLMTITLEDPTAVSRPLVADLFKHLDDPSKASSLLDSLRDYLGLQPVLDPEVAYFVFNHIVGLLKHLARIGRFSDPLSAIRVFGSLLTLAAGSALHVAEISIRDLRRNKVEFLLPSGALWFDETAPANDMFPRAPSTAAKHAEETLVEALVEVRVAQNTLTCSILRSSKKEVYFIKKSISRFMSPRYLRTSSRSRSFVPHLPGTHPPPGLTATLKGASKHYAISWATLIHRVLISLNRNFSDRVELAHLMEALSDIMLCHFNDGDIVGLCLQSYMAAMTRFQRLFVSTSAFTLVAPPLFQVYCQASSIPEIRDGIEYAVGRCFNVQEVAFVFQLCASLAHVVLEPSVLDPAHRRWMAKEMFELLASLGRGLSPEAGVALGLRGRNESYEAELLLNLVLETPEIDLLKLRRKVDEGQALRSAVPSRWAERTMSLDSVVKLFLTVIALEPLSVQADLFLRMLTLLTPSFVGSRTTSSDVLRQGVEALGVIFSKRTGRQAATEDGEGVKAVSWNELSYALLPGQTAATTVTWENMRKAYLGLVEAYLESGGEMSASAMRKTLALLPGFLEDAGPALAITASTVLTCFDRISTSRAEWATAPDAIGLNAIAARSRTLLREYSEILAPEKDDLGVQPLADDARGGVPILG